MIASTEHRNLSLHTEERLVRAQGGTNAWSALKVSHHRGSDDVNSSPGGSEDCLRLFPAVF